MKIIIKCGNRNMNQQQQSECSKDAEEEDQSKQISHSSSKEAEEDQRRNSEAMNTISVSKQKQDLSMSNSPKSILTNSDSSSSLTCSICDRFFPSKQSLFGHMKSHPEREWRGIQPPPPPPPPPLQSQSSTGSEARTGPLAVNWSVTGKRGRTSYERLLSDERISDAIDGLLQLKERIPLDAVTSMNEQINRETESFIRLKENKKVVLESSSEEISTTPDQLRSQERSYRDGFVPKQTNNIQSSYLEQIHSNGFDGDQFSLANNSSKKPKLDMFLKMPEIQDMGLQQSSCCATEFKCHTCNRTFPSHQALGGHKSSQRNCFSTSITSNYQFYHQSQSKFIIQTETVSHETKMATTFTHRCELCGETFASGQALGGHKRKHYTGMNPSPMVQATMAVIDKSMKKEMVTSLSKKLNNFDLNELPDEHED